MSATVPRRMASRVLLLVGGCVVGLLAAELALRLATRDAGLDGTGARVERFDLARLGYNDGEVSARKPPGEYRILSFGDSFTYGITPNEATWNGVAARRLARRMGRPVRVVNLGVRARSFPTYVRQWEYWHERLEHDAALFEVYLGNDLADLHAYRHVYRALGPGTAGAAPGPASRDVYLRTGTWIEPPSPWRSRLLDVATATAVRWWHRLPGAAGYLDTTQMPWPRYVATMGAAAHPYRDARDARAVTRDGWMAAADLISAAARAMAAGRPVAVILAPPALFFQPETQHALTDLGVDPSSLDPARPLALMGALAARLGASDVAFVDLLPCLAAGQASEDPYLGTNSHWTFAGNRVAGECVADALAAAWPLGVEGAEARSPSPRPASPHDEAIAREAEAILADRAVRDAHLALLGTLADDVYADPAALEGAFRAAGLRPDAAALRGSLDALVRAGDTPNAPPAEARGWAVALDRPESRLSVWVLADGRIVGFARTAGRRDDVSRALGLMDDSGDFVSFAVPLRLDCSALEASAPPVAYAITADGRYGRLPLAGPSTCAGGIER